MMRWREKNLSAVRAAAFDLWYLWLFELEDEHLFAKNMPGARHEDLHTWMVAVAAAAATAGCWRGVKGKVYIYI